MSGGFCSRCCLLLLIGLTTAAQAQVAPDSRVIVKWKENAAKVQAQAYSGRVETLSARVGSNLYMLRNVAPDVAVLRASALRKDVLLSRLRAQPEVLYAEEDVRVRALATANDTLYAQQWYLQSTEVSAIRANTAWDSTTGSSSVVVAVLDTGSTTHSDLDAKILPGYDFIGEDAPGVYITANDGDGRDADPSDPGDWEFSGISFFPSSWHGTRVAGVIGAVSNNASGIAGVAQQSRILPVRVLGVGGGYLSDVAAGIRWAAGLSTGGSEPANANPARVINLSLGAVTTCYSTYQDAIDAATAAGALVVASAGNETGPVTSPANCRGVLAVAGVRHTGTKVGYSSCGPQVGIAAPAGNCVNTAPGSECLFPIDTTTNTGSMGPVSAGYTDHYVDVNTGTSFSSPQAAGVAALMLAVNPALRPADLITRIQAGASSFPAIDSSIPVCPSTGAANTTNSGQCNCTTATCGAGLLNAENAVAQAQRPVAIIASPVSPTTGMAISLNGSSSAAISGATISTWNWSVSGPSVTSLIGAASSTVTLIVSANGTYTATLTITDSVGRSDTATLPIYVGVSAPAPSSPSGASCSVNSGTPSTSTSGGGGALAWPSLLALLVLTAALRRRH